jgi:hypothetical protein
VRGTERIPLAPTFSFGFMFLVLAPEDLKNEKSPGAVAQATYGGMLI